MQSIGCTPYGLHPKIVEARSAWFQCEGLLMEADKLEKESREELSPKWSYTVHWNNDKEFSIIAKLTNRIDYSRHLNLFGTCLAIEDERLSVTYYRFNNVLMHKQGGFLLLSSPIIVSDDDWSCLQSGSVPTNLLKS